jgi:DNA-binding transcriptional ArsR family regulator
MLDKIFGTQTAGYILLHLHHYGEVYARALARDLDISLSAVQKQLQKFEDAGVVVSKLMGRTRIYSVNKKSPLTQPLMDLIDVVYSTMSLADKEHLFKTRQRPRRPGKPVIG